MTLQPQSSLFPVLPLSFLPQYDNYRHLEYSSQAVMPQQILEMDVKRLGNKPLPNPTVYRVQTPLDTVTHLTPHFMEGIDHIYVSRQILESLLITEPYPNVAISLYYPSPPQATFIQLQPETDQFSSIPDLDPRTVLENAFRNHYHVLTLDQPLSFTYKDKPYYFRVTELHPSPVVLLTDAEPKIDFLPALIQQSDVNTRLPPPPLQIPTQDSSDSTLSSINIPNIPLQPTLPSAFSDNEDSSDEETPFTSTNNPKSNFKPFSGKGNRLGED